MTHTISKRYAAIAAMAAATSLFAQTADDTLSTDLLMQAELANITVTARRPGSSRLSGAENGVRMNREMLFRAACCNLGESFTSNPSVDVNYSDAATGAKQIRLLGLSGTYVQMLAENMPDLRIAASPYALDYVPGPWLEAIQVSKGASSVRNGYESITGQIDLEYLKPDADQGLTLNIYGNTLSRVEANADANLHLSDRLSTGLLLHFQDDFQRHDQNHDGFTDQPDTRQWNMQNRWKWRGERYLFHGGVQLLREERASGQLTTHGDHPAAASPLPPYAIDLATRRYHAYMKHAFILSPEHATSIALMGSATLHKVDADYGRRHYGANQKNLFAQLMFETNLTPQHNLSAGASLVHDHIGQNLLLRDAVSLHESELTPGLYAQYTFTRGTLLTAMAGLRIDHSSRYGTFATPRFHLKYTPSDILTLRMSAGKGYRSPHALTENHFLLASGRELTIEELEQERAWNVGISSALSIPLAGKTLRLNAEFYHTRFSQQAVTDRDSDPSRLAITNLQGQSFSNTFQLDATYPLAEGLELTAAYRLNDVRCTYGGQLMEKPLTSRYKGLVTASYKTPLGLWQFDATLQLNGGGRMPTPLLLADGTPAWENRFHAYEQLQVQLTRWFRHFSIYVGGENLTARRQHVSVIDAANPWGSLFDPTMVWGPVHGAIGYAGVRVNIGRM